MVGIWRIPETQRRTYINFHFKRCYTSPECVYRNALRGSQALMNNNSAMHILPESLVLVTAGLAFNPVVDVSLAFGVL